MTAITPKPPSFHDATLLKLAREIAMDIRPIEAVLETHGVAQSRWDEIQTLPVFQNYLRQCLEEWNSATNTQERVRLKALSMVEESLPEFYARMHDSGENLPAKTELLKTIAKFAGVGGAVETAGTGERLTVTINLGADQQLKIERDVTPQVIEGEAL